ncbi:MAG: ribonuclease HIII [Limnochordia bacterium]|jgi:ribonuclease HIII|nr:ribonuclease HIII [Limnochordia bacterium]MDD2629734.1 ribonuclease HIII [Limnochordia bacterium]MDD4517766.1 ribonuclease HIII [Limnochordia bacterium]
MSTYPRLGTDESGKGDYFGYLITAGAVVSGPEDEVRLKDLGVMDSKRITDNRALELAGKIKGFLPYEIVEMSPSKYNQLYPKFGNLNKLLAWMHARVIENLLSRCPCQVVIVDKFADEGVLRSSLMSKGQNVPLVQRTHAEVDLAVAAASILARARFLETLDKLSQTAGMTLPKGAVTVIEPAKEVVAKNGPESLGSVAKLHFKVTKSVLGE